MEKKYIFVAQHEESGQMFAGRKEDFDTLIKEYENRDEDYPYEIIARIYEPPHGLPIGFEPNLIDWYDKTKAPSEQRSTQAVFAIIKFIS